MRFPNENMPRFFKKLNDDEVQKYIKKLLIVFSMMGGSKKK